MTIQTFQPEQLQLSSGIDVILQHTESSVAATYWWVQTGSADEQPKEAGFAHFLEHMLFKDAAAKETGRASTGKMARMIESLGGDMNAYTSFDQTVYHVTCASHHWLKILNAFGTMAKSQRFLAKDFEREREVILEELRKNEDSPARQVFQQLFSQTFTHHPYGRPVIGYVKTLKAAKVKDLEAFYHKNYVPGKMGLILVGPYKDASQKMKAQILRVLETHYGAKALKIKPVVWPKRLPEPELTETAQWTVKPFDVKNPSLSFAFRVPDLEHEDIPALDLLSSVLGMGELSRLYQRLFYQTSLATEVSGGLYVPRDPGMIYFQAEVERVEQLQPALVEMFSVLRQVCEEGPTTEELSRVLVNAESERLYASQTADGVAGRLGFLKFIMGNLSFDQDYLDQLRAVDVVKIKEVANRYFDFRRLGGVLLVPKEASASVTAQLPDLQALSQRLLQPLPSKVATVQGSSLLQHSALKKEAVQKFSLASGMQVTYRYRPSSQVMSLHGVVLGGVRLEPTGAQQLECGSSSMMALTWTKGTSSRSAKEISALTEGHAASLDGFSGRNSLGLQMTGLKRDWKKLSALFQEVLLDPTFPEEELGHAKRIVQESIRSLEDHSSQLCSRLFLESLYESHPYGRLVQGSLASVAQMETGQLQRLHASWIRPERLVLSLSGAIAPAQMESWLFELEHQAMKVRERRLLADTPEIALTVAADAALKAPRWVERHLGREQTHIIVGGFGTQLMAEDRHALRLLHTLLGGQSGRLFVELREKKSLAYTVSPISFEGIEPGYVGTYIACAPQKKDEALLGIEKVLTQLVAKGPTAQEMNRATEYFMGRRAMDLQSDSALVSHDGLEKLYQLPALGEEQLWKKMRSLKPKDIQRVCKKYYLDQHLVQSVVG